MKSTHGKHIKTDRGGTRPFTLIPCTLIDPNREKRPGWELRIGKISLGKADTQDVLLAYYTRLTEPLPSEHWKERNKRRRLLYLGRQARKAKKEDEEPSFTSFTDVEEGKELETGLAAL